MKRILVQIVVLFFLISCQQKEDNGKTTPTVKDKTTKVSVKQARSEKREVALKYSGTVEASQTIPLSFRSSGTVERVLVEEGDFVKRGQLLATIDDTDAQNMLEIAQSKFKQAQDAYDRLKSVYDNGSLPEVKWVEMETNLSQARSSLELSKNNLEKCKLIAPASGVIGARNIEPGMSSINFSGSPLEIVDIRIVHVKISVPENEISKIKKGIKTEINVSAIGNKQFGGTVTSISPVADKFSRTYDVKIEVKNLDFELKPGMVCDVKLNMQMENSVVLAPYTSIMQDEEGNAFVFLVDMANKKAVKQKVETGNYAGADIEIHSGLSDGQTVVCEGKNKLTDNSLISW